MNTKLLSLPLVVFAVSAVVLAQGPPPATGSYSQTNQGSRSAASTQQQPAQSMYLKILLRTDVQSDLAMTEDQNTNLAALFGFDGTKASYTDSQVLEKLSVVLTADQIKRLKELAIQYLGYGALAMTEVQDALSLTSDQKSEVQKILAAEQQASASITHQVAATPAARQQNLSRLAQIRTESNAALAKVLTTEQDAQLKVLAGKHITSKARSRGGDSFRISNHRLMVLKESGVGWGAALFPFPLPSPWTMVSGHEDRMKFEADTGGLNAYAS